MKQKKRKIQALTIRLSKDVHWPQMTINANYHPNKEELQVEIR
jgi:hypothetical protein